MPSREDGLSWTISLRDGAVAGPRAVRGERAADVHWSEQEIEAALALAPEVLGLAAADPIVRGGSMRGRTTTSGPALSPDQMYVDAMGRVHVVEIKNEGAGLDAVAQILNYGDLFRMKPGAAMAMLKDYTVREHDRQTCLDVLRRWGQSKHRGSVVATVRPTPPHPVPFPIGLSPRHVVIASSFEDEAVTFVKKLTERGTSVELVEVGLHLAGDSVRLDVRTRFSRPVIEQTWTAFWLIWSDPRVSGLMDFVGWADHMSLASFAMSLRHDPRVRLWLDVDGDDIWLSTGLPDNYGKTGRVIKARLLKGDGVCPKPLLVDRRWPHWKLSASGVADIDFALAGRVAAKVAACFPPHP